MSVDSSFQTFVSAARAIMATPGAKPESSLYGVFGEFLSEIAMSLAPGLAIQFVPQAGAESIGIPDYRIQRDGELLGWIELKAPAKRLDSLSGHDKQQKDRFVDGLHNLILTNGWEWELYQDGKQVGSTVIVGSAEAFRPEVLPDVSSDDAACALSDLLRSFFIAQLSDYRTVGAAVTALAVRARALRNGLTELGETGAGENLASLKADFQNLVFRNGQKFDWARFVDSYVQIAAFGALLWRLESKEPISLNLQVGLKHGVHPLLYQCLQILWSHSSRPQMLQPLLEELCNTVNLIPPELFEPPASNSDRQYVPDPIVHAYEPFFAVYDSAARDAAGVYYTPVQVVEHMVAGVEHVVKHTFGRTAGLLDPDARYLDPATGTGTFLLGLAQAVARAASSAGIPVDSAVHELVTKQISAFELMPGPYTIAHQRMEALLEAFGTPATTRLPIFLTDTLAAPEAGMLVTSGFGVAGEEILRERERADEVKTADELLVVLGNPPYERLTSSTAIEPFAKGLFDILRDHTPEEYRQDLKSTSDLYVAFWLWALWALQAPATRTASAQVPKIDTRNAHGVAAFISNRTWIQGRSLIGLRSVATQGARDIWVLDLGGDTRGSDGINDFAIDRNVFDIQTGVAIVWVVFDREYSGRPQVHYRRLFGTRAEKGAALRESFDPTLFETLPADPHHGFVPVLWDNHDLASAPSLDEVFADAPETGFQTARDKKRLSPLATDKDSVLGVAPGKSLLSQPIRTGNLGIWSSLPATQRTAEWSTAQSRRAKRNTPSVESLTTDKVRRVLYRPLDYRWLYNDPNWVDWYRDSLQSVYNLGDVPTLITNPRGQGAGPAAIHSLVLPDQHAFNNRGGKGVWCLWRPADSGAAFEDPDPRMIVGTRRTGFGLQIVEWLEALDRPQAYEEAYSYVLATLSAQSYTRRNWLALDADSLRVPLTSDAQFFDRGVELGDAIRQAWELKVPSDRLLWDGRSSGTNLGTAQWQDGAIHFSNGRVLRGVSAQAWNFKVSRYRVLPSWFAARKDWPMTVAHAQEAQTVVAAAARLAELSLQADVMLEHLPPHT